MDLPFEISASVVDGLRLLNAQINAEITKKLIVNAVKQLLIKGPGMFVINNILARLSFIILLCSTPSATGNLRLSRWA